MTATTLQQKAYDFIKSRITNCSYPPGMVLSIIQLQGDLGYSRTPIREAIGRLEQEGLVRVLPKKGIIVCDLSINMISVIYETRMLIEPFIVTTYGDRIERADLLRLQEVFDNDPFSSGLTRQDFFDYDEELHSLFSNACPNQYLVQVLERIHSQDKRVRVLSGTLGYRLDDSCREHVNIINALLLGNLENAGKLTLEHLKASRDSAFRLPSVS